MCDINWDRTTHVVVCVRSWNGDEGNDPDCNVGVKCLDGGLLKVVGKMVDKDETRVVSLRDIMKGAL